MEYIVKVVVFISMIASLSVSAQTVELPYESVFKAYQTHKDVKLLDWKESNEAVRAAGGWRAYQKESQALDVPQASDTNKPVIEKSSEEKKP
jgi:hypothetical protein